MRLGLHLGLGPRYGGGAAAFTPASLFAGGEEGGYGYASLSTTWQDSAGTTPGAVGQPVGRNNDDSGNANHVIQATTAAKPILRQSGALYYLETDGVDDWLTATLTGNITGGAVTAGMSMRFAANLPYARFIAIFAAGFDFDNAASAALLLRDNATANLSTFHNSVSGPASAVGYNTDFVGISQITATQQRLRVDGGAFTSAAHGVTPAFNSTMLRIGAGSDPGTGNAPMEGRIYAWFVINRALTDPEAANLATWLAAKQGRVL